ncbi:MAG: response regulator transcription factor [Dehalococcoidales bacterium]|nr:response regulator transcription factor [Dehalococcoidales bacterium]
MQKKRVLIVDDDPGVLRFIRANLKDAGYETLLATNGAEALEIFEKELPNIVIMDITMPQLDGIETCRRIREWSQVPIIMLSAKKDVGEKVKCFHTGADDYVTKPFGVDELCVRIDAVLRRSGIGGSVPTTSEFKNGDLYINFARREVRIGERKIKFTATEYNLLAELAVNNDKVLTHTHLLQKIWGPEYQDEKEYLRVFIGRIRKELRKDNPESGKEYISTIPGVGYQLELTD